jgi:hypothetical protein
MSLGANGAGLLVETVVLSLLTKGREITVQSASSGRFAPISFLCCTPLLFGACSLWLRHL